MLGGYSDDVFRMQKYPAVRSCSTLKGLFEFGILLYKQALKKATNYGIMARNLPCSNTRLALEHLARMIKLCNFLLGIQLKTQQWASECCEPFVKFSVVCSIVLYKTTKKHLFTVNTTSLALILLMLIGYINKALLI